MNVLIRDVPDSVHAELTRRAENAGQSLQQYLSHELARLAARPTADDVVERLGRRRGSRLSPSEAAALVRADRDGR